MTDDDLTKLRKRREQAAGEDAYARGEAFRLLEWRYDEAAIGCTDDGVCVIFNAPTLDGVTMSAEDARKLATAPNEAAGAAEKAGA